MPSILDAALVLLVILVFSGITLKKKSLDNEGAMIAAVLGWIIFWLGGLHAFSALLIMFVAGDLATRFARNKKSPHERRTTGNIIGNGGAAAIAIVLGSPIAFFSALSAALADTVSSEIGMLSREKTRLLIDPRKIVAPGTDGGITLLGIGAAILGAVVIAGTYYFFTPNLRGAAIVLVSGVLGSLIDSVFGGLFERRKLLNNMEVNFLGSGFGALIGFAAFSLLA